MKYAISFFVPVRSDMIAFKSLWRSFHSGQESEENVQVSLQKIPAIYREVLVLRFQEELQIEEMAGVLSIPLSTVKSRLYRGLEALRGALQGGTA